IKHQRDFEKLQADQRDQASKTIRHLEMAEKEKHDEVAKLMKQYNQFFKEAKYQEAMVCATKAKDLDPDNTVADAAIYTTRFMINETKAKANKQARDDLVLDGLNDTDRVGPVVNMEHPVDFDAKTMQVNRSRRPLDPFNINKIKSEKEQSILRRLDQPISTMDFKDTPLKQVLDDIQGVTGINVVVDEPALLENNINLDKLVTMRLDGIALKSALNLVLHQAHLTYVVDNEVLNITTEEHSRGKMVIRMHPVVDLIMPVPSSDGSSINNVLRTAMSSGEANLRLGGSMPATGMNGLNG